MSIYGLYILCFGEKRAVLKGLKIDLHMVGVGGKFEGNGREKKPFNGKEIVFVSRKPVKRREFDELDVQQRVTLIKHASGRSQKLLLFVYFYSQ